MKRWREVEEIITDHLRDAGFKIECNGDTFAKRGFCQMAMIGEPACKTAATINITEIAKEIAL